MACEETRILNRFPETLYVLSSCQHAGSMGKGRGVKRWTLQTDPASTGLLPSPFLAPAAHVRYPLMNGTVLQKIIFYTLLVWNGESIFFGSSVRHGARVSRSVLKSLYLSQYWGKL